MKWIWIPVVLAALTVGVEAKSKDELDLKIRELTARLETLQAKPDKRVPAHLLAKAKGIVLMDRTKAGFVFAYQGGAGVAMVRDKKTGAWGPPAFLKADEGSLGFQVGSQKAFVVILLMKEEATRLLTEENFHFGGEARGTAGNESTGAEGNVHNTDPSVIIYNDLSGLYGGAAVKAGSFSPDDKANQRYYGQYPLAVNAILFEGKVKATEAGERLARKVDELAKRKPE